MKCLVIQQKMIGDVLTSTLLCEVLREQYPDAEIHYLVNSNTLPVLAHHTSFDKLIEFKPEHRTKKTARSAFYHTLRQAKYTHVYDVLCKWESAAIAKATAAPVRVSFRKWYLKYYYTHTVVRQKNAITNAGNAIENRLRLILPNDAITDYVRPPKLHVSAQEKEQAQDLLVKHNLTNTTLCMVSILGSEPLKTYPAAYMAKLLDALSSYFKVAILLNYLPDQEKEAHLVYKLTQPETQKVIHLNVYGKGLRAFIALLNECDLVLGNEGGAINMAKALGKPTFSIFSPQIPKADWSIFEDGIRNGAIHLSDIYPELIAKYSKKQLVKNASHLYQKLTPELVWPRLLKFITSQETVKTTKPLPPQSKVTHRHALTAIVPCFNEAHNIEGVLKSVAFADEILLVDSFSTDNTLELAKPFTDRIIQREYQYSTSQKNWAIPQATHEWILLVDADERVTPALKNEILKILENPGQNNTTGYWIYRDNHFMGKHIKYSGWQNDKVIRLFHRDFCRYEDKHVHGEILTSGQVGSLQHRFYHNTYTGIDNHIKKLHRYATWQAKDYDTKTNRITIFHFLIKPFWRFLKHYVVQQGFRDGVPGFVIACTQSYAVFLRYVKLWLMRRGKQ